MGRRLRFLPPGQMVEVTCRTIHGRHLLEPSAALNEIVVGIVGRAQRLFGLPLHAIVVMSNHYHLLTSPGSASDLARFMGYVNGNLAKEVGRFSGWREKVWGRRYQAIPVSDEEAAQVGRLKYLLSHGAKEGRVTSPLDWHGVHSWGGLLADGLLRGAWFDRSREYEAGRRAGSCSPEVFTEPETMSLTPIPCWASLPPSEVRERLTDLLRSIEAEALAAFGARAGGQPAAPVEPAPGTPSPRGTSLRRRPAPLCHAASRSVRAAFLEAYRLFVTEYREASRRLRSGLEGACFPPWSFPPALPFVHGASSLRPTEERPPRPEARLGMSDQQAGIAGGPGFSRGTAATRSR
ncbi:MAG TPA: transposase [Thermoanaerobaculia bacterium]|nr:transposase [Thermoanaerobaculia bacterium]